MAGIPGAYTADRALADILNRAIPYNEGGTAVDNPLEQIRDDIHALREELVVGTGIVSRKETLASGATGTMLDSGGTPVSYIVIQTFSNAISFWIGQSPNGIADFIVDPTYGVVIIPWSRQKNVQMIAKNASAGSGSYSLTMIAAA